MNALTKFEVNPSMFWTCKWKEIPWSWSGRGTKWRFNGEQPKVSHSEGYFHAKIEMTGEYCASYRADRYVNRLKDKWTQHQCLWIGYYWVTRWLELKSVAVQPWIHQQCPVTNEVSIHCNFATVQYIMKLEEWRYSKFHIGTWKFKVKVMAQVKTDGHNWDLEFNPYVCFSFRGYRTIFGWDIGNSILDIENSRSRSRQKVTKI